MGTDDNNNETQNAETENGSVESELNRRDFLTAGIGLAGSLIVGSNIINNPALAEETAKGAGKMTNTTSVIKNFKGTVLTPQDAEFKTQLYDVWNKLVPLDRVPQMIVIVNDEDDVIEAVKYAREKGMKVSVRGGGHNWCNPSIRNSGMMIDLTNLNKVISIDAKNKKAITQPIVSNRDMQKALNAEGLSYPTGHCPQVKMSGYLLSGGMSWNQGVWGPGVGSIDAIELITPEGKRITASAKENQDYFWMMRGAGCGTFGIAIRYHLNLYDLPKYIAGNAYYLPISEVANAANWLEANAKKLDPSIELSLWLQEAPANLQDKCKADNGKCAAITATCFADSEDEARTRLKPFDDMPFMDKCLSKSIMDKFTFENLFDISGSIFPEHGRNEVNAMFSDSKFADIMNAVTPHFVKTPSKHTVLMYAIFTGPNVPQPTPKDAAFSMNGHYYGGPWTYWKTEGEDPENRAWQKKCIEILNPFTKGYYVSETDTVTYPDHAPKAFQNGNFAKIAELRKKHDPTGVFFDYEEGLTANKG